MIRKLLYAVAGILFLISAYLVFDFFSYKSERNERIEQKGQETTALLKTQVDGILAKIVAEGNRLATELGSTDYTAEEIESIIKESSLSIPEIQGVTACYEPFAFDPNQKLYCPYYNKGTQDYLYVGKAYDYSVIGDGTAWYTGVRDNGAKWVEPYFAKGAQDWYIDYGIPFYYTTGPNKGKVRGTITMSFVASGFKSLIHSLSLGKTGFGIITNESGTFLSHRINENVGTQKLQDQVEENEDLKAAQAALLNGESGHIEYDGPNGKTLFYYDQIPTSKWGIGLTFYKKDLLNDDATLNRKYIRLSLFLTAFFLILIAIYFNKDYLDRQEIWTLSILTSVFLIANLVLIGYLTHNSAIKEGTNESPPITDVASVDAFIAKQHQRADELKTPRSIPVPTGIYIQRMQFQNSYNLDVGGTVWQKYPIDIVDSVDAGFRLPQMSPFAEASYIEESYRKKVDATDGKPGYVLIGYEFRVTLQQNLKYGNYPFDKRHITLEIQPKNANDHLIFTPDLESYNYTNPLKKSGLNPDISISGNKMFESYFNYTTESYDTDFGMGDKGLFEEVPVLHFNVHLRRQLLNAFVTDLIPIFVTLIMMFILLIACGKTEERQGIIESMAAFFFVLIFSHIDLRKEIITADLIYMEYFYFCTYLMIILTTFNLITYSKDKSKIFDFNENQVYKAVYFPIFWTLILIITLVKFY